MLTGLFDHALAITTGQPSSETQGQLVEVGKSLNGAKKNWAKKSQEQEEEPFLA